MCYKILEEINRIREIMNINENIKDIAITIPKTINWFEYQKELDLAENGEILNFKVPFLPKDITIGKSKCYLCYNGQIIGYNIICGLNDSNFDCTTTGKHWEGKFIQRTGKFIKLDKPIPCKGFRNFKYFHLQS